MRTEQESVHYWDFTKAACESERKRAGIQLRYYIQIDKSDQREREMERQEYGYNAREGAEIAIGRRKGTKERNAKC